MLTNLKLFFQNAWGFVVLILGGAVAVLLYFLNLRNKELEAYQDKIALAQDQKAADLIEVDIKKRLATEALADNDRAALEQSLVQLEQKRTTLTDTRVTNQDRANSWNNKK